MVADIRKTATTTTERKKERNLIIAILTMNAIFSLGLLYLYFLHFRVSHFQRFPKYHASVCNHFVSPSHVCTRKFPCDNIISYVCQATGDRREIRVVLRHLLPPVAHTSHITMYCLRPRAHDRSLPERLTHLTDCNFIIRALASPAIGHWGTGHLELQQLIFFGVL